MLNIFLLLPLCLSKQDFLRIQAQDANKYNVAIVKINLFYDDYQSQKCDVIVTDRLKNLM